MTSNSDNPACIVAMMMAIDNNKLIGKGDAMPWHIPGEQIYFKEVTMGKPIIMGRKTYDSIGRPLPGRPNFVVTRNVEWSAEGVYTCTSLLDAIDGAVRFYKALDAKSAESGAETKPATPHEVMVIGGAGLCRDAMPMIERIYLTHIDHEYEGDVWLDSFEWDDWQIKSKKDMQHEQLAYSYLVLERAI